MKKNVSLLFALLLTLLGSTHAVAQSDGFADKIINLGSNATSLAEGQWYVLYNGATSSFTHEGTEGTLGLSTTSPEGTDAQSNIGYLVQLESAGTAGRYYIKSGRGNYYGNVTTSKNNGTSPELASKYAYTIAQFGSAGHWSLRSNNLYYLYSNGGKLLGSSSIGSALGDRDWTFRQVSFSDMGDLQGTALVQYILGSTHLVRICNRRNSRVFLSDNGNNAEGAGANSNSLAQVWILAHSGNGYTLRNASTGRYLGPDNNFRTTATTAKTLYIRFSPNNGTDDAYINISENADHNGKVSLNLGTDGTTLFKWTSQGDAGCDWSISLADNFTMEEVEDYLRAQTNYAEPTPGKYYRIKNINSSTYANEDISANLISGEAKNADKLSQYWTLIQEADGKWHIQNLCTQRYIAQQNGTTSVQYRTTTYKASANFNIKRTDDATTFTYYILDSETIGLHCTNGNAIVGWNYNATNSLWAFEEAELDEQFIAEGRAKLANYNTLLQNLYSYKNALGELFTDKACTTLKDEIQAMSDDELAQNAHFATLNADIQAMVLKVKNNTWQGFTSSTGYSREAFEKFFRIRDDFYVYSNNQKMAWNEYAGMSNAFGKLSGPTGIVGKAGDIIYIYVDQEPSADCTLQAEVVADIESPGDRPTGTTTSLHAGLNVILMSQPSTLYIFYQLNDPEKYLADYPAAKLHIEGGQLQGYFDHTRGMTNQDWTLLYEKLLNKSIVVNLKSERVVFAMLGNLVKNAIGRTGEAEGLMRVWSNFVDCEEDLMGFKEDLKGRFRNIWNAFSVNHGYMYSTTYGTYYSDGTIETVMNYNTLTSSGGAIWGPSHEIGHNHQACFNIVGATEVSNNLFSNANVFLQGISTTRGTTVTQTLEDFARGTGWFGMTIWEQTRFYYQLYLYFHAQGHNPNFYPTLFKMLRRDPIRKRSNTYDASLVNGDGETVGGYISYGSQDYLHMAKKMCDAAQLDLSELFEVNGMFVPYDKFYVGDYGDYWVTTTEQDIQEAKAYMSRYPKAPSICFIDDRIKPSPVITDSPLEGKPQGEYRMAYDTSEAPTGYADVGQWSDFVNDYQTNGYYYIASTSQGRTIYNISGEGAIGFKVYDNDGKLIYLSNNKKITPPDNVTEKMKDGFSIVACEANGYEVLVPNGAAMYRGEMTVYFEGNPTPHTMYYYGTGTAAKSEMRPLPANSVAYVKAGQSNRKKPTEELLANDNVVNGDGNAQSVVIDGNKPFFVPTDFTAGKVSFSKTGSGYKALRLPFDTRTALGYVAEDGTIRSDAETYVAGLPVVFSDYVSLVEENRTIHAGTYAETEKGYIMDADGTLFVSASNISPFTYVWDNVDGIGSVSEQTEAATSHAQEVYNIAGQRIGKPVKGVNIIGGRKILIK